MTPSDYLNGPLTISNKERITMKIGETEIKSSNYEKLLGIKVGNNLTFNEHFKSYHRQSQS